ncbi:D-3-phosphoglycerate dehydrogenase [Desulfosarcina widdelii]|uniref:D-3-phosphoglycerate dehydrogenase n=1 Tax=Desulfosarcina widdelii TaxID=947919 RepID=A0A5K7Z958_9BACT|nr:phosphoglycerate dehydrogenase [Desulfosarcina widdelii]BBO75004.1 D-3-phosphoglycerate dehydrogenase [Desulfosarcina widdelii]
MKVLVSDNLGEDGIRMFQEAAGIDVDVKTGLEPDALKEIIASYDALVIRSATKVTKDLLQAASKLKVVGRAGIGLDNVDIPEATQRGIVVMNTPTGNVITTAEHAIAMMLSLTRNIPTGTASLRQGRWEKKKLQGREIFNKTLGVIGFGKIGAIVADRARGLRMNVIIHDPFVTPEQIQKAGFESVDLDGLYERADYITVHVPKLKNTIGMLNKAAFEKMKPGVMIVNCARGGIVDESDLYEALESGRVAGAALDVFETEPPGKSPLVEHERVICTPHLGASTREAQTNVAVAVARQIIDFLTEGTVVNAVNMPSVTGEVLEKIGPYLTLADRMGCLQAQLVRGPIKEVVIEFCGDFKGIDLSPVSTAVLKGILTPVVKDDVNFVNAHVMAQQRGITVTETSSAESDYYVNQITVRAISTEMESVVSGTIFGKKDPRIVKIDKFRLEMIPEGHMALIQNIDKPGSIGEIGTTLGQHQINIGRMQVGQEEEGDRNIVFLTTDTPIPEDVVEKMRQLSLVKTVTPLEF